MNWEQQLEDDLRWRQDELASLKNHVMQVSVGSVAHRSLLRALWTMLYAHYEGYCLFAFSVYLENVEKSGMAVCDAVEPVCLLALEQTFRDIRKRTPPTADFYKFCREQFHNLMNSAICFERDSDKQFLIKGKSNLYPRALKENYESLGLTQELVDSHQSRLGFLVTRRNSIAHGKQEIVADLSEYLPFELAVIEVMHELTITIIDAIECKAYMKPSLF